MRKIIFLIVPVLFLSGCVSSKNVDYDQSGGNTIQKTKIDVACAEAGGTWLDTFSECENVSESWCKENAGLGYNSCESACRHNPEATVCTMQCVQVCSYSSDKVLTDSSITVSVPVENQTISSPLKITGSASGTWYFEGDFPVKLLDQSGDVIAQGFVTAEGDWMTEDMVPFSGVLTFSKPAVNTGILRFEKDNPSDLPENDESYDVPIKF